MNKIFDEIQKHKAAEKTYKKLAIAINKIEVGNEDIKRLKHALPEEDRFTTDLMPALDTMIDAIDKVIKIADGQAEELSKAANEVMNNITNLKSTVSVKK